MSKAFILLLVALVALVAVVEARPIIYFARQTSDSASSANGWLGNVVGYLTITKGRQNHRFRIYGAHNINDTVTGAWLTFSNGTQITELGISESNTAATGRYIVADLRINQTVFDLLINSELYVTVYSERFSDGAISGVFRSRPNTGVARLTGDAVVPSAVSTEASGFGYTFISDPDASTLPLDLVQQTSLLLNNASFDAQILHNVTGATEAIFAGPANDTSTATTLVTIPNASTEGASVIIGSTPVTSDFYSQQLGLAYLQVNSATNTAGEIRGTVYPTLGRTRRAIPTVVETVAGTTSAPNGYATLRFANQQDNERNDNSFITLTTTADSSTGNFTYQAFFRFPAAASRRNYNNIRGLVLELNLRQFGDATWNFDFYDSTTGEHIPTATFSSPGLWTPGYSDYFLSDVHEFNNNRGQLIVRVTVNSATTSTLWVDLFAVRSYEPTAITNEVVRSFILQASLLPSVLGSESDD